MSPPPGAPARGLVLVVDDDDAIRLMVQEALDEVPGKPRFLICNITPMFAARQTPPLFPKHLVPYFPSLPVDNVRSGFFERAEVEALLQHVADDGIRDFIAWGFRTGMRKGEIARLTWDMLDRSGRRGSEDPGGDHEEPDGPHARARGRGASDHRAPAPVRRFDMPA